MVHLQCQVEFTVFEITLYETFLQCRSLDCGGGVRFAEGITMTPEQSINIGWGHDLITCTLEFISRLTDVSIDRTEFSLLNAVVLRYPGMIFLKKKF